MSTLPIHQYFPEASRIVLGTMHVGGWNNNPIDKSDIKSTHSLFEKSLELGINVIDLADIYTFGKSEAVVGKVFKENKALREQFILQSKVGIRLCPDVPVKHYDLSAKWVNESLHNSLKRLETDYLDVFFLHRPDPLMQIEQMAAALNNLHEQNKFGCLAVSNMHAGQIAYIQNNVEMPVIANQLELSLKHSGFVEDGITCNMQENAELGFPRGTLEFCMQQSMQLQAWGALAQGQFSNTAHEDANIKSTAELVETLSHHYECSANAIVLAWLMMHPANIQAVVGTNNHQRLEEANQANQVSLTREHWYGLLEARRGQEVP